MLDSGFMPLFNLREVTEISKAVDVLLPLGRKQQSLVHRTSGLFTLHTFLKAVICCLQLNTGGGSDDNVKVISSHRCSWMAVYVSCCIAQLNLIGS